MSATSVLIFGTGAVGSIYGYVLSQSSPSTKVTAICRSNYDAVSEKGISIRSSLFGDVHYAPITARTVQDALPHGPFDYIVITSKALPDTAVNWIKPAVSPSTTIVIGQNGIGIEKEYRTMYPDNPIVSGVVWLPTTQVEPGVIEMGKKDRFIMGTYPANAPESHKQSAKRLYGLWRAGGGGAEWAEDVQGERWIKLGTNAAFNPITALTRCDTANLLRSCDDADDLIVTVLREVATVAKAAGYPIMTEEQIQGDMQWQRERKTIGGKEPSMLVDVKHEREVEVEAILGNLVRIAEGLKVEIKTVKVLYTLLKALNFAMKRPEGPDGWIEVFNVPPKDA